MKAGNERDERAELVRLAHTAPDRLATHMARMPLATQAALALALPAAERLELLLHAPKPMRLVRTLPDSELYLTVREVGPSDALPLVALASAGQLHHLLDLEAWRRDRFDGKRAGAWVALLLEAGEPTLRRFLRSTDDDTLALLAQRWMRVRPNEAEGHGHEIQMPEHTETGHERGIVTPDGGYLMRPLIPEHAPAVRRIAHMFCSEDPERYLRVMWSAVSELPSELEERALHWRRSRLEEHGFPPWEEALSIYAAPAGEARPAALPPEAAESVAPSGVLRLLGAEDPLVAAVDRLPEELRSSALHELVCVANRLLVVDGADTGDPAAHREALCKAAGYVSLALEARHALQPAAAREVFGQAPVAELFRQGHAHAVELQAAARALLREGWAASHPQAIELLEPAEAETIRALVLPRPQHAAGDGRVRAFRSMREIEADRATLETAALVGRLMVERLGLDVARVLNECAAAESEPPRFSAFVLTLLAWHAARGELRGDPLPAAVVSDFLRAVGSRRTAGAEAPRRAMRALVDRMITAFDLSAHEAARLRAFGEACLERLVEECSALDPGVPVDPRYVTCLLLAAEEA